MTTTHIKAAQIDLAGIAAGLKSMGGNVGDSISGAGRQLGDWYQSVDPEVRSMLTRGLLGAGAGATALGLTHALGSHDPDETSGWKSKALLGAILGGTGAAALPAGLEMLSGGLKFPNESHAGPLERATSGIAGGATRNYGAAAGAALGGWLGRRGNEGLIGGTLQGPSGARVRDAIIASTTTSSAAKNRLLQSLNSATPAQLRAIMNRVAPGQPYTTLTKSMGTVGQGLSKVPGLNRISGKLPARVLSQNIRRPALSALKSVRDPRVKMLLGVLLGAGGGYLGQKGLEGSV